MRTLVLISAGLALLPGCLDDPKCGPGTHPESGICVADSTGDTEEEEDECQEWMPGGDCDETGDPDTDSTSDCEVEIRQTFPAADSVDFYHRGVVEFHLNKADETAEVRMQGVPGSSSLNARNDIVTFAPESPLSPSTSYTVRLNYCTGQAEFSFTTSELGGSAPASNLEGKTYEFNVSSSRVVEPEGVGAVMQEYLEFKLLVSPVEISGGQVHFLNAAPSEVDSTQQDFCRSTRENDAADYSEAPFFQVGPLEFTVPMSGADLDVEAHLFTGTFAPDGGSIGGITLAGLIDTRPLVPLMFEGDDDPNAICSFLSGFGVSCVPCGGNPSETYCLAYRMVDGVAQEVGTTLEVVGSPCSHAQCDISNCDPNGSTCSTPAGKQTAWWVALVPLIMLPRRRSRSAGTAPPALHSPDAQTCLDRPRDGPRRPPLLS